MTVTGTGFVSTTTVQVGGVAEQTTYVSGTQVTAALDASQLVDGGSLAVIAINGDETSGAGTPVNLTVNNPAPVISALSPSVESVGAASAVISVVGTGFVTSTTIDVNGSARTTTFVSGTQVNVLLNATDVATSGSLSLTAVNSTPGGGTSAAATLAVNTSAAGPTVSSISPTSVTAGAGALTLTVNGTGFSNSTVIEVGGVAEATTYISGTQISAIVEPAQLVSGAALPVVALDSGISSGAGSTVKLTVNNPSPTIAQLTPAIVLTGANPPVIYVAGTGFVPSTVIDVNGTARTTAYVSSTQVNVDLIAADIVATGSLSLTAMNGTPGGGTSAVSTVAVNNPVPGGPIKISPTLVLTGTKTPTTETVTGTNFVPASTVQLNGVAQTTTYVSPTQVTFQLTSAEQATTQVLSVMVVNPTPGGGNTLALQLEIVPQTPTPVITQVQPTQIYVQSGATSITVSGTNLYSQTAPYPEEFFLTSSVLWNGTPLTVQEFGYNSYPSPGSEFVVATVPASLLSSPGTATVTVSSATSTPATSNAITITISNPPVPTLTSISPNSGLVNTAAPVTLTGTGFAPDSTAVVGGTSIPTTYYSSTQLSATIPASALVSPGSVSMTVNTPAPGGGNSAALPFTASNPPAPTITYLQPSSAPISTPASVTIEGTGFTSNSSVALDGVTIPSTYDSANEMTVTLPASSLAVPGNVNIAVTTPAPGGGTSAAMQFTAYVNLVTNDIVYSPTDGLIYASVPGSVPGMGNSVVGLDPATGNVQRQIFAGSNPNKLALSTDGTQLFVGLDGAGAVAQINLTMRVVVNQFQVAGVSGANAAYSYTAYSLAAVPGMPNSVAASSTSGVTAIYDSGVARSSTTSTNGQGYLAFGSSATTLFLAAGSNVEKLTVGPTGITGSSALYAGTYFLTGLQYDSGILYLPSGAVINASSGALLGTFYASPSNPATGPVVSDSSLGLAFIASSSYLNNSSGIFAYNESTFNPTGAIPISGANGSGYPSGYLKIIRWGQNGLAVNTTSQIFIFQSPVVKDLSPFPADLSVTLTAPSTATTGTAISYVATVANSGPNSATGATLALALDSSLIINSVTPSQGTCGSGTEFTCDLGDLAKGATATVTVSATPTDAATIAGSVTVTSVSYDPTTTNNQATASTTVTGSSYSMFPVISSISPNLVEAGSGVFTLTVNGTGFDAGSTVNLGGAALTTTYVSGTQLTASVPAAAVASYGWAPVTVSNSSPGGGNSAVAPLTIYAVVNVPANAILFDPFSQQIYASVPSASTTVTGNSIVAINPVTASAGTPVLVGSEPNPLAETSDGSYLYIGLNGSNQLVQFNLLTQQITTTIPLTYTQYGSTDSVTATSLAAMPGTDTTLAIGLNNGWNQFGIFDVSGNTGAFRPNLSGIYEGLNPLFASPTLLYAFAGYSFGDLYSYSVGPSGFTLSESASFNGLGQAPSFPLPGGLIYGASGGIINPSTTPPSQVASLDLPDFYDEGITPEGVSVVADPSIQKDFLMLENTAGTWAYGLERYSTVNYLPEATLGMPSSVSNILTGYTMFRWGQSGLAILASANTQVDSSAVTQVLLIQGPFVTPQLLGTGTAATLTSSSTSSIAHGAGNTLLTITGSNFAPGVAVTWNGSYRTTTIVDATHVTVAIPASDLVAVGSGALVATNPGGPASSALTITIN